jgi:hypothetical protein
MKKIINIVIAINLAAILLAVFVLINAPKEAFAAEVGRFLETEPCGNSLYPNYTVHWEGWCVDGSGNCNGGFNCGYLASVVEITSD